MSSKISINGEKIKDGSILLSTLSTDIKERIDKLVNITYDELK